jgi:hypothetical protein
LVVNGVKAQKGCFDFSFFFSLALSFPRVFLLFFLISSLSFWPIPCLSVHSLFASDFFFLSFFLDSPSFSSSISSLVLPLAEKHGEQRRWLGTAMDCFVDWAVRVLRQIEAAQGGGED